MDDQLLAAFGAHIKKLRLSNSLSQEQLALRADIDRTYISGIERGKRNVSVINLFKIADALNIPASTLLDFKADNK
ncbi:helix-turn-helix transcriptional regulator [uncultured Shewanella sp.]|uniref:helix-turn-helix domain-containing protein n=1 Tax=uncultured Shewanella sp. TaxID=173975 RepID=UPI00262ECB4A|nr:helix-turn-helix transcriptional regulator [uncultured Shewanella sp.]